MTKLALVMSSIRAGPQDDSTDESKVVVHSP